MTRDETTQTGPRGAPPVAALSRGLTLLEALGAFARPMGLAELARAAGLHKTTASRLLRTLADAGFVQRTGARHELGPAAFRLGLAYQRAHLVDVVRPTLVQLAADDCESPSFHIRCSPDTRLCVLRLDAVHGELDRVSAGDLLPLAKGAAGRVLTVFEDGPPAQGEVGVVVSWGERDAGCASVAAPVFGRGDRLCGALAVSGPRERFGKAALPRLSVRVLRAAAGLTARLGGDPAVYQASLAA